MIKLNKNTLATFFYKKSYETDLISIEWNDLKSLVNQWNVFFNLLHTIKNHLGYFDLFDGEISIHLFNKNRSLKLLDVLEWDKFDDSKVLKITIFKNDNNIEELRKKIINISNEHIVMGYDGDFLIQPLIYLPKKVEKLVECDLRGYPERQHYFPMQIKNEPDLPNYKNFNAWRLITEEKYDFDYAPLLVNVSFYVSGGKIKSAFQLYSEYDFWFPRDHYSAPNIKTAIINFEYLVEVMTKIAHETGGEVTIDCKQ